MKTIDGSIPISHLALLATVLFNVNKTQEIELPMDDSKEVKKVQARIMGLVSEGEAVVAVIPMAKILKYAANPYTFKMRVELEHAIISFEKQENHTTILNANGAQVSTESETIQKLLERI